jgi:MFS transporter, AAHS family, 4-hydroxybenzoate transporter
MKNISPFLDEGPWTGYRKWIILLISLAVVFDGFEIQILSFAIPQLVTEWGVGKEAFALPLALGLIGMTVGSTSAGAIGDRVGRRKVLLASVFAFGALTAAIAAIESVLHLNVLRFLSGLALGGALPSAAAYAAEFTPRKNRAVAVTLTIVCVPLGGMIGGLIAASILPTLGWRALFVIGGTLPMLLAVGLVFLLPESPRFLVREPHRSHELSNLLHKMGLPEPGPGPFADAAESHVNASFRELLSDGFRRDTLGLWCAFFCTMVCVYIVFGWVPTLLTEAGFDIALASRGLALFNLGGVIGAVGAAFAITLLGSRKIMLVLALAGMLAGFAMFAQPLSDRSAMETLVLLTILGLAVNGVQTTMFALASHLYPAPIRGTGVGSAISVGRLGAISVTYLGATILTVGGSSLFFGLIFFALGGATVALMVIRNHIMPANHSSNASPSSVD